MDIEDELEELEEETEDLAVKEEVEEEEDQELRQEMEKDLVRMERGEDSVSFFFNQIFCINSLWTKFFFFSVFRDIT